MLPRTGPVSRLPKIVVATIALDRAWILPYMLDSLLKQDYPKDRMFFVYVDGGSKDGSPKIVKEKLEGKLDHKVIVAPGTNIPEARNIAIEEGRKRGDYIVFWDSDVIALRPDALRRIVEKAVKTGSVVGADVVRVEVKTLKEALEVLKKLSLKARGKACKARSVEFPGLNLTVIPMELVERVGLFDEDMTTSEDKEYGLRLRLAGFRIISLSGDLAADVNVRNAPSSDIYAYLSLKKMLRGIVKRAKISVLYHERRAISRCLCVGQIPYSALVLCACFPSYWYLWLSQFLVYLLYEALKRGVKGIPVGCKNVVFYALSFFPTLCYLVRRPKRTRRP